MATKTLNFHEVIDIIEITGSDQEQYALVFKKGPSTVVFRETLENEQIQIGTIMIQGDNGKASFMPKDKFNKVFGEYMAVWK